MSKVLRRPGLARGLGLLIAVTLSAGLGTPAQAATRGITVRASVSEVLLAKTFTLFGQVAPKRAGVTISRQVYRAGSWKTTGTARTNRKGDFRMVVKAPSTPERLRLRVTARITGRTLVSATLHVDAVKRLAPEPTTTPTPAPTDTATVVDTGTVVDTPTVTTVAALGAGKRILGADISRYQHPTSLLFPDGAPIDFAAMYQAGARFVIIKGSDGRDLGHNNAAKWYAQDRANAQAAGLYTGFYHYAYFPATTNAAAIVADAVAQADKAVWRLASVGGYTARDLPFALDLEEWCVNTNSDGSCAKVVTQTNATLWTKTWLARVAERTGRKPIVYSSPAFLTKYLARDPQLRDYPLWMAHYGPDPRVLTNFPSMKSDGTCYINAWTLSPCIPQWTIWQYTSSAKADKFGIAGGNLDLNLFSGGSTEFLSLTKGDWLPAAGDFLPFNETTTATVRGLTFSTITKPLTFTVDVARITGGPVVSGTVSFVLMSNALGVPPTPAQITAMRQSVKRLATGTWQVTVNGLPAGTWLGQVSFRDSSGVHAASAAAIVFTLIDPNPPVTPSDTATVTTDTPTVTP